MSLKQVSRCVLHPDTIAYLKRTAQSIFVADVGCFGSLTIIANCLAPRNQAIMCDDKGNVVTVQNLGGAQPWLTR